MGEIYCFNIFIVVNCEADFFNEMKDLEIYINIGIENLLKEILIIFYL